MNTRLPPQREAHPFLHRPHRTFVSLSLPVLVSLVAEPLTALADTAFIARLGATPLAALGVATTLLSSILWMFNFLGIGTQTRVAQALGARDDAAARESAGLAVVLALGVGMLLGVLGWIGAGSAAGVMGATGAMRAEAVAYLEIRLLGAPAVLATLAAFGALRGLQDMHTPLRVALGVNALNIVLDALLIFGAGPIPALGIRGAAWASTVAQWLGVGWAAAAVVRRLGAPRALHARDALELLVVGRDLFLRTGLLLLFIALTTRAATRIGADAGAAHHAVRQVWMLAALLLDAYAATAQSLVGFFLGAGRVAQARRVAGVACVWSAATGAALLALMLAGESAVATALVPAEARALFGPVWLWAALSQPLNALAFATDGIHWGTGDYRYLRNAMLVATGLGAAALFALALDRPGALEAVWLVTAGWIALRALFGTLRVWPGLGASPLRPAAAVRGAEGEEGGEAGRSL